MGSINCPACSRIVMDQIDRCPDCGTSLPKATAADARTPVEVKVGEALRATPFFFPVSLLKLVVLSTCTFGLYEMYWFWRNWNRIRVLGEPEIKPSLRAFFLIFYCYPCFIRIKLVGISRGVISAPPFGLLAICYILATFLWRLPAPLWLICFIKVAFLLPVQSYVNQINAVASPGHDPNSRFSIGNWIAVVLGGLLFVLVVIGTFMPREQTGAPGGNHANRATGHNDILTRIDVPDRNPTAPRLAGQSAMLYLDASGQKF